MRFWERFLKPKKVRSVVYTCLTGGYDSLKEHRYVDDDWDYVCFTDNKELLAQKNAVFGKSVRWLMLGLTVPEAAVIIK